MVTDEPGEGFLVDPPWMADPRASPPVAPDGALPSPLPPPAPIEAAIGAADPTATVAPGLPGLREAIATARDLPIEAVVPGAGADALVERLADALLAPGTRAALAAPLPSAWTRAILAAGARYVDVGRDGRFAIQDEALERVLADGPPRLVVLGRPPLPGGPPVSEALVDRALEAGASVVVDQRARRLVGDAVPDAADRLRAGGSERLIVLESPTVELGLGGLRVGYALASPELARRLWRRSPDPGVSAPAAAAAEAAARAPGMVAAHLRRRRRLREALRAALAAWPHVRLPPTAGAGVLLQQPGVDGPALAAGLRARGVAAWADPHPSWHEAVAIPVPPEGGRNRVVAAVRQVLAG